MVVVMTSSRSEEGSNAGVAGNRHAKTCSKCGAVLPATAEYFYRDARVKDGLCAQCKACCAEARRRYYEANRERAKEYGRRWYEANRERHAEYGRLWREASRDKERARNRRWYETNLERHAENGRRWKRENPDRWAEYRRRRRSRKNGLPFDFSAADEAFALDYFDGCCAVCGRPLRDLFGQHCPALDHWIPLVDKRPDNPGTVPWNMVPLCHGVNGCNNSKHNREPLEWLTARYSPRKARRIAQRIEAFFQLSSERRGQAMTAMEGS